MIKLNKDDKWKHLTAFFAFVIAFVTYFLTMAPTVSFWDCGEFVACANTLGIPHPPGTPFFVILARAVIILLPFVEEVAKRVNYISVFTSAATIYVVYIFIWDVLTKVWEKELASESNITSRFKFSRLAGAFCGSMLLAFSDTFWFNAVEAEVYGLAMFMLVLISWLAVKWLDHADTDKGNRILILICYVAFLGVGVHLYTLLTIPAVFALLVLHDVSKIKERLKSLLAVAGISLAAVLLLVFANKIIAPKPEDTGIATIFLIPILIGLFYKLDSSSAKLERWPIWISGVVLYSVVYAIGNFLASAVVLLVSLAVIYFIAKARSSEDKASFISLSKNLKLCMWFCLVALIGYSNHAYIPIRSELDPIIDENNPEIDLNIQSFSDLKKITDKENWLSLNNFLERKQYGSESMISRAFYRRADVSNQLLTFPHMGLGGYQIAQYLPYKVGEVNYIQPGIYTITDDVNSPLIRGGMEFPTQMSFMGENDFAQFLLFAIINLLILGACYRVYKKKKAIGIYLALLYFICSFGLMFYINFSDGTKIEQSEKDRWVRMIDGASTKLSEQGILLPATPNPNVLNEIKMEIAKAQNPELRNALQKKSEWVAWRQITSAFTSAGYKAPDIPDPVHLEVRERDYFYTPSFIFMSMMIGIGLAFAFAEIRNKSIVKPVIITTMVLCIALPAFSNYKEHDRSGLYVPWDYAYNLINSCKRNSIIFTNGDNDTFPLWFIQEVEGIRKDVRVVNLSLGNTDWYIHQILDNEPKLKLSYDHAAIDNRMTYNKKSANDPSHRIDYWSKQAKIVVPVLKNKIAESKRALAVSADQVDNDNTFSDSLANTKVLDEASRKVEKAKLAHYTNLFQVYDALLTWAEPRAGGFMKTQDKLVIDLIQNNPNTPIHFASTVGKSNFVGLEKYMEQEGMVYTLIRGTTEAKDEKMNIESTLNLIDSVFKFRGLGDDTAFIGEETMRLLYNYNSIYLRLAIDLRSEMMMDVRSKLMLENMNKDTSAVETMKDANKNQIALLEKKIDKNAKIALRVMNLAIKQFPDSWRNYVFASEVSEISGDDKTAVKYLEKGIEMVDENIKPDMIKRLERLKKTTEVGKSKPLATIAPMNSLVRYN